MFASQGSALMGLAMSCALTLSAGAAAAQCGSSHHHEERAQVSHHDASSRVVVMSHQARPANVVEAAVEDGRFTILARALGAAHLVDALQGDGPFTVFAPTDDAFRALERERPGTLETLLRPENRDKLTQILTYHVVAANVLAEDVVELENATTLNGQRVDITVGERGVRIDESNVIITDIETGNGTIHVIDRVLLPSMKTIVDIATSDSRFSTLVQAVSAAGLVDTLSGEGPFTVFAPTNDAFASVPGLSDLLKPSNRHVLQSILKYHVVPGRVYARDAVTAGRANTVEGSPIRISIDDGQLTINGARITTTDIETANGVIHVLDAVILPPSAR